MMLPLKLIVFFLAVHQGLAGEHPKPKGTVIVFRHGDRVPINTYPNDPYGDPKLWPVPWGQLTPMGMAQHYMLGKRLRTKYGHLLSDVFNTTEIYVRSTAVDRTIMSAQANLAGLYPVKMSDRFNPDIPWRPAAVYSVPSKYDELLTLGTCPKFGRLLEELLLTEEFERYNKKYEWVLRLIENHTGKKYPSFLDLIYLHDSLMIEESYGFPLPEWTKAIYPETLKEITNITYTLVTYTPEMARLSMGSLINEITKNLIDIDTNNVSTRVFIYSAHDTNIVGLLNAMNLKKYEQAPYAAVIMFDLVPGINESAIQVFYQYDQLDVPDCGETCPLSSWIERYQHLFVKNRNQECEAKPCS